MVNSESLNEEIIYKKKQSKQKVWNGNIYKKKTISNVQMLEGWIVCCMCKSKWFYISFLFVCCLRCISVEQGFLASKSPLMPCVVHGNGAMIEFEWIKYSVANSDGHRFTTINELFFGFKYHQKSVRTWKSRFAFSICKWIVRRILICLQTNRIFNASYVLYLRQFQRCRHPVAMCHTFSMTKKKLNPLSFDECIRTDSQ